MLLELMVALGILTATLVPLGFTFVEEQHVCRDYYFHAVAMEIVDGEIEVLAAGAWTAFGDGVHAYPVRAGAARNLPPSRFVLTIRGRRLRLEWLPAKPVAGGPVVREAEAR